MGRGVLLFLLYLGCAPALKSAEIAFFIKANPNGEIEIFDEKSPYTHVAIRVGDKWLDARPYWGVRLSDDFSGLGEIAEILVDESIPEPGQDFLNKVLGKKYFLFADWYDPEVYNCTKLVAEYLGIPPNPMSFDPHLWGDRFHEYLGLPGLSPGELKEELLDRGYLSQDCLSLLR